MTIQVKQLCFVQGIILANLLLISNLVSIANATTLIPTSSAEIDSWFDKIVTPVSERKKTIDFDIVEAEHAAVTITVRKDGSGMYKTIEEAVKVIETGNKKRVIIDIGPGKYEEKIRVERYKPYVTFYGNPNDPPTIVFGGTAATYGTVDSATLIVESDDFIAANLILKNSAPPPNGKTTGAQAAALRVSGDETVFYNCKIYGYQDTLCDDKGKHLFKDCYIEGSVDFIFGEGRSIYLNSELHIVDSGPEAVITAHARKNDRGVGGYSFVHCKITGTGNKTHLGRPWGEGARVVFSYCEMGDAIMPDGWNNMKKPQAEHTVFFGEYKNKGPGAKFDKRVKFAKELTDKEAEEFISMEYIEAAHWLLPKPTKLPPPATTSGSSDDPSGKKVDMGRKGSM